MSHAVYYSDRILRGHLPWLKLLEVEHTAKCIRYVSFQLCYNVD